MNKDLMPHIAKYIANNNKLYIFTYIDVIHKSNPVVKTIIFDSLEKTNDIFAELISKKFIEEIISNFDETEDESYVNYSKLLNPKLLDMHDRIKKIYKFNCDKNYSFHGFMNKIKKHFSPKNIKKKISILDFKQNEDIIICSDIDHISMNIVRYVIYDNKYSVEDELNKSLLLADG